MAPGSSIYAAADHAYSGAEYDYKSSTSMASPEMAGCAVLTLQYPNTEFPEMTAVERMLFARSLMMSAACPGYTGIIPCSPVRKRGYGKS